ncbi:MAG: hypothetical protein KGK03_01445 [Candidatus Omnitrophica bacterium]|nr:hypothetical protein [Candidatus Omnitrophota bacterium]MDE2221714.1 hypothetical protein [Candidatus Omnitrophota bacterium]
MRNLCLSLLLLLTGTCLSWGDPAPSLPYYKTIMEIMAPLRYSGVPVMVKPQVYLSLDFAKRTWTIHNIHEYDQKGNIILAQGRYGLCAELATYLFEKIKPFIDNKRYDLKFAMVTESDFFSSRQSNHIVLLLADKSNGEVYLIDPSFHRYGRLKDLPEYKVLNVQDTLSFVQDKSHDVFFSVNQAMPLYIKKDYLLSFAVTSVDGKFDKDNFIFVISANRRYKFSGHDIVLIGRRHKEFVDLEDKTLLNKILTQDEISTLFDRLKIWLQPA